MKKLITLIFTLYSSLFSEEYFVKIKSSTITQTSIEKDYNLKFKKNLPFGYSKYEGPSDININNTDLVIEPDGEIKTTFVPNDSLYSVMWGLQPTAGIDMESAYPLLDLPNRQKVKVGVFDTGFAYKLVVEDDSTLKIRKDHPDFDYNRIKATYNATDGTPVVIDKFGHGTHVTGTIGATTNNIIGISGIDNLCDFYIVKVFNDNGSGKWEWLVYAAQYAIEQDLDIISLSGGGGSPPQIIHDAVASMDSAGIIQLYAAGNTYDDIIAPAKYSIEFSTVFAVLASNASLVKANFSSFGPEATITAPGVSIMSLLPTYSSALGTSYGYLSGTSMATPHTTGVVAIMKSFNYNLSTSAIKEVFRNTSTKIDTFEYVDGWNERYGFGLLDAYNAISEVETTINNPRKQIPLNIKLYQNYPNPFNSGTNIGFDISSKVPVNINLEIYNLLGQKVKTIMNKKLVFGSYKVNVDFKDVSSGIYFYRLSTNNYLLTKKMAYIK